MLDDFGDGYHFGHGIAHRAEGDVLDLGLLELLEDVAHVRLYLGAGVDAHDVVRNLFAFNCGLDNLFVFLHDDLI